ncbi:MAG: hypothetical protein KGI60_04045 [Patescibacteria group bacterium]|nr:hypothetical protein [Patescibacteria group bacterium]
MNRFLQNIFQPASILTGTIIGAGVFSLPLVFVRVGLATGLIYLALFGALFIVLYLLYADVIVRTPGEHRFVGYAKLYLGKPGFAAALVIGLVELLVVLAIYLILAPSFLKLVFGGSAGTDMLVFWALGSASVAMSNKRMGFLEFVIVNGIALIIALIFLFGFGPFLANPIRFGFPDLTKFSVAGPILFSLSGSLAIPEMIAYFRESKLSPSSFPGALVLGMAIPVVCYAAFVIGIIGLSPAVSGDSVTGLMGSVPAVALGGIGILGFLALISSYVVVGLNVRHIIEYDLGFSRALGFAAVVAVPPVIYLAGLTNFTQAVSFAGSVFLPLESFIILLVWKRMQATNQEQPVFSGWWAPYAVPVIAAVFLAVLGYVIL